MTAQEQPRDPVATSIMARLDPPEHGPGFWERLVEEFEAVGRDDGVGVMSLDHPADSTNEVPAEPSWNGAAALAVNRSRQRSRLALLAVAAVLVVLAGYSLIRVGDSRQSIAPADPTPDESDSVDTSYAHLGDEDREWAFSDRVAWVDDRFVALTSFSDQEWHWTSSDGISWQRQDGPSDRVFQTWAECAPGFSCDIELPAEPLPFLNAGTATRPQARAGDRLLVSAWVTYGVFGVDLDGFAESGDRLDPELLNLAAEESADRLDPELLDLAAENDGCFRELRDNPDAGTVSGGIVGETGNWRISLQCRGSDPSLRGSFSLNLGDHMTPAQAERAVNPQNHRELWLVSPAGAPQPVEGIDDWLQIASSGDRFWMLTNGNELITSVNGSAWQAVPLPVPAVSVQSVAAGPSGHVAIQFVDAGDADSGRSLIVVSHDDGFTWSEPVEVGGEDWLTSVGGAGAAILAGSDLGAQGLLVNDGQAVPLFTQPKDLPHPAMTVGEDRVLVQNGNGLAYYEVFDADGALIHRASADIPSRRQRLQPFVLVTLALAVIAGALLAQRRHRRPVH